MSNIQTGAERVPHDLSHLVFSAGKIGRLMTLSRHYVKPGDSYELDLVGALRLSPLRRGLAVDSKVEMFSFYIPMRQIFGDEWVQMIKDGIDSSGLTQDTLQPTYPLAALALNSLPQSTQGSGFALKHVWQSYLNIYNNYFKVPYYPDLSKSDFNTVDNNLYGFPCGYLKNIWSAPVPKTFGDNNDTLTVSGGQLDLLELNKAYSELHTQQERDLYAQRYRDVVSMQGGWTPYDGDNRPELLMHSEFWASGYDINGTDQSSLGQHSGRVQQSFKHSVPRYFCREHGMIITVALVRFPSTHSLEKNLLDYPGYDYFWLGADDTLYANHPPVEVSNTQVFNYLDSNPEKWEIAAGQWWRYNSDVVHSNYYTLQGYPFLDEVPKFEKDRLIINTDFYKEMFQTEQLGHWNIQARANVNVLRALPTARDSIMTN